MTTTDNAAPAVPEGLKLLPDGKTLIPSDWAILVQEWEPGYPEDIAVGPSHLMERLKKWLDAYFQQVIQRKAAPTAAPSDADVERLMTRWSEPERSAHGGAYSAHGEYLDVEAFIRDVWQEARAARMVDDARGFVSFGAGVYRIQQCTDASLVVTFRRSGEEGYGVGDRATEIDQTPIPAEDIIVKLQFQSVAALDGLEQHLREIRSEHFPGTASPEAVNEHRKGFIAGQRDVLDRVETDEHLAFQQWWKDEHGDRVATDNEWRAFRAGLRASAQPAASEREALTDAQATIKELEDEVAGLESKIEDLESVEWPDWANQVLKIVRSASGYDGFDDSDGVDIPGEVQELADEYSRTYAAMLKLREERDEARAALHSTGKPDGEVARALAIELRNRSLNGIKDADELTRSAMSRAAKLLEQYAAAPADAPVAEPVAYLYHDAPSLQALIENERNGFPVNSVLLSIKRQSQCRNETPLYTRPPAPAAGKDAELDEFLRQTRELCAQTIQNPGKPVTVPAAIRAEWLKLMRDEDSIFDRITHGELRKLGESIDAAIFPGAKP